MVYAKLWLSVALAIALASTVSSESTGSLSDCPSNSTSKKLCRFVVNLTVIFTAKTRLKWNRIFNMLFSLACQRQVDGETVCCK